MLPYAYIVHSSEIKYRTLSYNMFDNYDFGGKMPDKRVIKTKAAIEEALLELMEQKPFDSIGMSEIAEKAGISRSTLYSHYSNLQDAFVDLVISFHESLQPLTTHLKCSGCEQELQTGTRVPYCRALRNAGRFAPLIKDSRYLPSMLRATSEGLIGTKTLKPYLDAGLSEDMARRMYTFQMSACYSAAMSVPEDEDWSSVQSTIDRFIAGGLNALRNSSWS